jgi:putative oxidoreductase
MRDAGLLGLRLTLGGYLAAHGAQKLFGALDGPGLAPVAANFEKTGIRPGHAMAVLAGGSEFFGGLLTATGLANPVGPLALAGAMTVATAVHGDKGPMAQKGGYELALTNAAAALALAANGPGRFSLDSLFRVRLPKSFIRLTFLGAAVLTGYNVMAVIRTKREVARATAAKAATNGAGPAPAPVISDAAASNGAAATTSDAPA